TIHEDDAGLEAFDETGNLFDLTLTEIGCRPQGIECDNAGLFDIEVDGAGKPDRLIQPCGWLPLICPFWCSAQDRLDHQRSTGARAIAASTRCRQSGLALRQRTCVAAAGLQSSL